MLLTAIEGLVYISTHQKANMGFKRLRHMILTLYHSRPQKYPELSLNQFERARGLIFSSYTLAQISLNTLKIKPIEEFCKLFCKRET